MIEFYKKNIKIMKKFWINQFTMSLLGLMVTQALIAFAADSPNSFIPLLGSVFSGGFLCFLVYDVLFERGGADGVKKESSSNSSPHRGLLFVLFAYIPTLFFLLLELIFTLTEYSVGFSACSLILNFVIHAMYQGLIYFSQGYGNVAALITVCLTPLLALFFGWLAYYIGYSGRTLRGILGINVNQKTE